MLFGNSMSFVYSIAGGVLSGAVMILLKRTGKFSIVAVCIAGGVAHNIGQILAAIILLNTTSIAWYPVVLWFTGVASGAVIGILGGLLCKKLHFGSRYQRHQLNLLHICFQMLPRTFLR